MSDHPSRRFRRPSLRALLALSGAAAVVVSGAIATTDTLAASTDEANAQVSQIATQNFFPTPLPSGNSSCSESGTAGFREAKITWPSAGAGYTYRLNLWNAARTEIVRGPYYVSGASYTFKENYDLPFSTSGRNYWFAIHTVNTASGSTDPTRQTSSGFLLQEVLSNGQRDARCRGGVGREANATWEDGTEWTPQAPQARGLSALQRAASKEDEVIESGAVTPTQEVAEKTTDSESSTSTEAEPSEETTPSSTEQPAPSSTEPAEDDAEVTIGIGVAGDKKALIVSRDGEEVCHTPLEPGDQPSINGNTVVIQSGDTVKSVDTTTCAVS